VATGEEDGHAEEPMVCHLQQGLQGF
jgi:hypothetical protein